MSYFALAALELTLLGLLSGLAGTLIVLRRRSFFAVALSHATFPGGVVFAVLGWNLLLGQALFALLLVLVMTLLSRIPGQGRQVASGVVLSLGFALGTLLASLNPGLGVPVEALLVGSPLGVTVGDVTAAGTVLLLAGAVLAMTRRRILFHTFDPVGSRPQASGPGRWSSSWPVWWPRPWWWRCRRWARSSGSRCSSDRPRRRARSPTGSSGYRRSRRGSGSRAVCSGCGRRASSASPRADPWVS